MGVNLSKTSHVIFFAGVLPVLSLALAWGASKAMPNPPFWAETLSPLLAYAILYGVFEKYLWSWEIFRLLGVSDSPDLRGRWEGAQRSSYKQDGSNVAVPSVLEIRQSFNNIFVSAYYEKSQSSSIAASFVAVNGNRYLFYTYDSDPNSMQEGTMQIHKGTVKLAYVPQGKKLIGAYFNSIGNRGDMEFSFAGRELLNRFAHS